MFITRYATQFTLVTLAIFLVAGGLIAKFGLVPSIDFTGGSLTEYAYTTLPEKSVVETSLTELGLVGFSVRESVDDAGRDGFMIRTKDLSEEERVTLLANLATLGEGGELGRFTTIGPVIGEELKSKAAWAVGAVALVIVLYVAFAFRGLERPVHSWVYGGITILSLIHDVLIPVALMSVLGFTIGAEVDVLFVMAILAVLGYSVNDTIVVFDRVRENVLLEAEKKHQAPFPEVVGRALEQSFLRSFNTSFTTLLALAALYFLGGEVTKNFALVLIAGVVAGTYSSIFMTNPLLVLYAKYFPIKEEKKA